MFDFEQVVALTSAAERAQALNITGRELSTIQLVADGLSTDDISARLYLAAATIKDRLRHAREKLGAANRPHLVHLAYQHGLLDEAARG